MDTRNKVRLSNVIRMASLRTQERFDSREVRSYEVEYVNGLWHLDFHHGSRNILGKDGKWYKPLLLAISDDRVLTASSCDLIYSHH